MRLQPTPSVPDAMPHALIVDDDTDFLAGLTEAVTREGFSTASASNLTEARAHAAQKPPDVVLADLFLPDGRGLELIPALTGGPRCELIVITGQASVDSAVEALRAGASDYIVKPVDFDRVKMVLATIARTQELKHQVGTLRSELRRLGRFGPLIGASAPMQKAYDLIARVAQTEASILLLGETGTGKELAAQAIHDLSKRRKEVFLPVNCGAISPSLIESELFGHERGSFTGAERLHRGYFERAHRGTLFLDEITEMPLELQVKLLRVLEIGKVARVGGAQAVEVDVRVIAASNRKPEEALAQGKLREDLLYRLNVFPIELPALRERPGDVELLAEHFLATLNMEEGTRKWLSPAALHRLRQHSWPGNVRELKNVLYRAFILADGEIDVDAFPLGAADETLGGADVSVKVGTSVAEAEKQLILATLQHCEGDKRKAAEVLGISLKTLYNRINAYRVG
jgi:two-component system, NtrC family, response regulator AtoC